MALFRVDASFFPRHFEVPTRCLMTILRDQSGNDVALANELSETPGMEEYTFLRLTSYSFSDSLTRLIPFGSPGCSVACDWAAIEAAGTDYEYLHAPKEPDLVPSWSTTTSVDTAGWTQVVIQRGQYVLLDVKKGQLMAMVNTSINDVFEAGLGGRLRRFESGGGISDGGAFGRLGFEEMSDISISCPSFNEVTI